MSTPASQSTCDTIVDPLVVGDICNLCGVPHDLDGIPDFPTPPSTPAMGSYTFSPEVWDSGYMSQRRFVETNYGPTSAPRSSNNNNTSQQPESSSDRARRGNGVARIRITVNVKLRIAPRQKETSESRKEEDSRDA